MCLFPRTLSPAVSLWTGFFFKIDTWLTSLQCCLLGVLIYISALTLWKKKVPAQNIKNSMVTAGVGDVSQQSLAVQCVCLKYKR